jgi:hypothetical protein
MSIDGNTTLESESPGPSHSVLPAFGVKDLRQRIQAVQAVMHGVMKEGTHFGTIPGTPKPSLWKAGAEVLCLTFRLTPILESRMVADDQTCEWAYTTIKRDGSLVQGTCVGFFEVEATCTISNLSGEPLSRCSARCNNREANYRVVNLFEIRNTVLKMAEKRAFVSAVLMATGASDIFTQDIEDLPELVGSAAGIRNLEPKPRPPALTLNPLSPRREAWLIRAAQEAELPSEVLERCLTYLRSAENQAVNAFFDDLSRRRPVFQPFKAMVG